MDVLGRLGMEPKDLLRPKEAAAAGLSKDTPPEELLEAMAAEPTLVQRPIALLGERALLARPADLLTSFLGSSPR